MTNTIYFNADEVATMIGVSRAQAYKIIKKLNIELDEKNFITVSGKISKKYFNERYYGGTNLEQEV